MRLCACCERSSAWQRTQSLPRCACGSACCAPGSCKSQGAPQTLVMTLLFHLRFHHSRALLGGMLNVSIHAQDPQASAAGPSSLTANVGDASSPPQAAPPAGGDTLTNGGALPGSPTQNGTSGNLLSGGEKQQWQQDESAVGPTGGSQRGGGGDGGGDATAHDEEPGAEHEALAKNLNVLGGLVSKLGRALPQADADALREAFNAVGGEADRAFSQVSGGCLQRAYSSVWLSCCASACRQL